MSPLPHRRGVLLIGHGTRDEVGRDEFFQTAELVRALLPDSVVEAAFLELAEPTISEGLDRLMQRDLSTVVVVPVLLFAAGHAKRDIPAAIAQAAERYPALNLKSTQPLGCHPKLLELSKSLCDQQIRDLQPKSGGARLLVVGRGSPDAEATAETYRYAALLAASVDVKEFAVAFLAMCEPTLAAALHDLGQTPKSIIVQPHLLFQGELLRGLKQEVEAFAAEHPDRHVRMAGHLGPSPLLAAALADLVGRT